MPKNTSDRYRLVYLTDIFRKYSDEEHPLSLADITARLEERGVNATRQTLYRDLEDLRYLGYDIRVKRAESFGYYLSDSGFDLAELKLMVDAVQSAKFITGKSCDELINKIGALTSVYRARKIKRQVYTIDRVTKQDTALFANIDAIHDAIASGVRIIYKYYDINERKERVARHNGEDYLATPIALIWDDEFYYLVAFDSNAEIIKHFRVDKMGNVRVTDMKKDTSLLIEGLDISGYGNRVFGMYGGRDELVTLVCDNSLAGVIVDKFGPGVTFFKSDRREGCFSVNVHVSVSPNFYSWVTAFGGKIVIKAPEAVAVGYRALLEGILDGMNKSGAE